MYTYGGDANLSGHIDADDYFRIDSSYNKSGSLFGYYNGDFNYDGAINGDDYFIIDANFVAQVPSFSSGPLSARPVPEPASLAALIFAIVGVCPGRRRRSR